MFEVIKRLFSKKKYREQAVSAFRDPSTRIYVPIVKSWLPYAVYHVGPYICTFFTSCENQPENQVQYLHVMWVYKRSANPELHPCFATACETSDMIKTLKAQGEKIEGSYVFGIFPCNDTKHTSLNWSDEWANRDTFTAKSLEVVKDHFNVSSNPVEIPLSVDARQRVNLG
jgi:hypothetical protein